MDITDLVCGDISHSPVLPSPLKPTTPSSPSTTSSHPHSTTLPNILAPPRYFDNRIIPPTTSSSITGLPLPSFVRHNPHPPPPTFPNYAQTSNFIFAPLPMSQAHPHSQQSALQQSPSLESHFHVIPALPLTHRPASLVSPPSAELSSSTSSSVLVSTPSGSPNVPSASASTPLIGPSSLQRVECALCGKSFSGISSHNRHVSRTHQKARPFSCTVCGLQFGQKGSLDRHTTAVHLKVKPFSCDLCKKSFGRKDNMKIHMTTVHLKKKPYKCDMCVKSFGGKRPLNIHRQTVHFKQRPLKCPCCDKRFGQKSNLNVHMKVHTREGTPATSASASASASATRSASASHSLSASPRSVPISPIGLVEDETFSRIQNQAISHTGVMTHEGNDVLPVPTQSIFAKSATFASSPI